jgi:hypothetical protein
MRAGSLRGPGSRRSVGRKISWPAGGLALHLAALADDGSIAPDPRRLARAHRAGLRPSSPWLVPAALCLGLAAALRWLGPALLQRWQASWTGGVAPAQLGAVVGEWLAGAAALVLLVALLGGGLGWVDARAGRGLGVGGQRSGARGALTVIVAALVVVLLAGVCAGAARAVDASETGLWTLWWAWSQRLLFEVGGLLLVAGLVDRALARHRLWRALHQTADDLRRGAE